MKIALINTYDIQGGAARAAYRLHRGLIQLGHDSIMLSRYRFSSDETVQSVVAESGSADAQLECTRFAMIQSHYIDTHRTAFSNTLFSLPYPGFYLTSLQAIQNAEVINLHWVAQFQSPVTIKKLGGLNKPIVWTLHDMWPFTGGCHYSAGCSKYQQDCSACFQIANDPYNLAAAILADKIASWDGLSFTIVAPSRWLADCARQSTLFCNHRIEVIPNSLETDIFAPLPKADAKSQLGIDPETTTLLFGAATATEKRKGFSELIRAIEICLEHPQFQELAACRKIEILCFGYPSEQLNELRVPVRSVGFVESDAQLGIIYSAANLFILPSLEDNLPNTMLEAMSCGTPVLAFNVGGIPDVVIPGKTGWLVPDRDVAQLAEALLQIVLHPETARSMGSNCRHLMEEQFSLSVQANRYLALYQDLLGNGFQQSAPAFLSAADLALVPADTTLGSHIQPVVDAIALPILEAQLYQSTADLKSARAQIQQQQAQIQQQQAQIQQQQAQIQQQQAQIQQQQAQLVQKQSRIDQLKADKRELGDRLQKAETRIGDLRQRIEAMQSSKFWKLRTAWVSLKQRLGGHS